MNDTTIVIMAGGRGLRLHPLTEKRPKPMLKVGNKPILESIMDSFSNQGFKKFILCVNYLANLIEDHFGDGSSRGWEIEYIHESEPLGTAGSLRFLKPQKSPFIVHNADIVANVDFHDLLKSHKTHGYEATVCLGLHQHQVPFGVARTEGRRIVRIDEKPIECFNVAAGIYVLPTSLPRGLPEGPSDMPDVLNKMTVGAYAIEGTWIDLGHFNSLAHAHFDWTLRLAAP